MGVGPGPKETPAGAGQTDPALAPGSVLLKGGVAGQCCPLTFPGDGLSLWELGQLAAVTASPWLSHLSRLDRVARSRSQLSRFLLPLCSTGSEGRNSGCEAAVWASSFKLLLKIYEKLHE